MSPRALSEPERGAVLEQLHDERFVDCSPAHVYATLLDEGTCLASERTMYRLLAAHGEVRERRDQLTHPPYARPELLATHYLGICRQPPANAVARRGVTGGRKRSRGSRTLVLAEASVGRPQQPRAGDRFHRGPDIQPAVASDISSVSKQWVDLTLPTLNDYGLLRKDSLFGASWDVSANTRILRPRRSRKQRGHTGRLLPRERK